MARQKDTAKKDVPMEESAAFLAVLDGLPAASESAELERIAGESLALLNDAMRGNAPAQVERARLLSSAVIYRLNGDTFFGCAADGGAKTRLLALHRAAPGYVPSWGQDGEWFADIGGMRMWIRAGNWSGVGVSLELHAIDADQPFLSDTGYRSHRLNPSRWLGHDFGAAVRMELEQYLQGKVWKSELIRESSRERLQAPDWLVPALEGVMGNGQQALPLSGRAPVELPPLIKAEPKAPMSNADRQREFRRRQKELRENQGLRTISLTRIERCVLSLGLLAHEDLDHRGSNWINDKKPEFDALLQKLWPEGDNGRYLSEPKRSTYRPTAWLRGRLDEAERRIQRMDEIHQSERDELFALRKENAELKAGLQEVAAELGGASAPVAKPAVDVEALQAELARVRRECEQLEVERCQAFAAVKVFEDRMRQNGLSTDYRAQSVE